MTTTALAAALGLVFWLVLVWLVVKSLDVGNIRRPRR